MPGNPASAPPPTSAVPPSPDASAGLPADFAGVISLLDADGQIALAEKLKISARLIRYDPPDIVLSAGKPLPADLVADLAAGLQRATGQRWKVTTDDAAGAPSRSEEHTSELQSLMRISYAVFCL